MLVIQNQQEFPERIPLFAFDPVSRTTLIKILEKEFIYMVPLGMRQNIHKYLVLQEFSGSYWYHLSPFISEIPEGLIDDEVFDSPRDVFDNLFENDTSRLFVAAQLLEIV